MTFALSCMAKKHGIWIVVDMGDKVLCEKEARDDACPPTGYYQYNTQVAFGSDGKVANISFLLTEVVNRSSGNTTRLIYSSNPNSFQLLSIKSLKSSLLTSESRLGWAYASTSSSTRPCGTCIKMA